jgi:hypothetical protein
VRVVSVNRLLLLREDYENARGKSRPALGLWKSGENDRTDLGNLVEICQQLDLIMVCAEDVSF